MEGSTFSQSMAVLYLLGAVQGLFLAAVLASRHRNALPNRLLAGLMRVFSVDLAMAVYHTSGGSEHVPALIGVDLPIALLYGPLLYLYVRASTAEDGTLRRTDLWHLAPFAGFLLFLLPFYLRPGAEKLALMHAPDGSLQTRLLPAASLLKLTHGFAYLTLVIVAVRRHLRRGAGLAEDRVTGRWLQTLTIGVAGLLVGSALLYALGAGGHRSVIGMDPSSLYDDLTLLGVTTFVYAFGYFGLRHPSLFVPPVSAAPTPTDETPAYARTGMRPAAAARHAARLTAMMETEHLYRRGDLTLPDLADALGLSPHNLTEVLSTQLGQSFYDMVNGYRVREVQTRLTDPSAVHLTVLALGMDAGFNAKSSFNAAFKRHTGMTPSEYRQRHAATV